MDRKSEMVPGNGARRGRILFIDRMRGVAVLVMFMTHSAVAWLGPGQRDGVYWTSVLEVGGVFGPVFMFLAGLSIALLAHRSREKNIDERLVQHRITARGLQIMALGYGMHLLFWSLDSFGGSWTRILKVDILHCIGLGLVVFPWVAWPRHRFNGRALAFAVGLPLLLQVTFRLPVGQYLPSGLAAYVTVGPRLAGFPFVPYGAWMAMGLFVGPMWLHMSRTPVEERRFWTGLTMAALLLLAAGKGIGWINGRLQLETFLGIAPLARGTFGGFLFKAAWVLMVFAAFRATASLADRLSFRPAVLLGETSLFAYCVHLVPVYYGIGTVLKHRLTVAGHVAGFVLLTIGMYVLAAGWTRWKPAIRTTGAVVAQAVLQAERDT